MKSPLHICFVRSSRKTTKRITSQWPCSARNHPDSNCHLTEVPKVSKCCEEKGLQPQCRFQLPIKNNKSTERH